ncbi:hypothetical protein BTO30_16130 [Domibacillus antri]|uniref:Uncharacterized protein n=2 Tax=Domibacillus antri TaxID=1714264 RepID=A0A1Q8Q1N5_9BACI|nr:hypothetical protein BTO30_16130 [Domibacillus antri]
MDKIVRNTMLDIEDGVYAIPHSEHPKVKVRALYEYCQSKGIFSPKDLTPEEMRRFVIEEGK